MIALLFLALAIQQTRGAPAPQPPPAGGAIAPRVQMGVRVQPETVTVGQRFVITVRVRAPRGAEIAFPPGPDSGLAVEAVDPRIIERHDDSAAVDRSAVYRLVAWDTGGQGAHLGALVVTIGGVDRRVAITGDTVVVRSVLPADTSLQTPKPARDILLAPRPWWQWALAALVAAALIALLWWWWRRHRRRRRARSGALDPYETARRELARIDALGLLEAGEHGRYVALHVDVLRDYLAAKLRDAPRSMTSTELLDALRDRREVPLPRLAPVLAEADLIKFARRTVTAARAQELARELRGVLDDVERALQAAAAAAAAAAAQGRERAA